MQSPFSGAMKTAPNGLGRALEPRAGATRRRQNGLPLSLEGLGLDGVGGFAMVAAPWWKRLLPVPHASSAAFIDGAAIRLVEEAEAGSGTG